MKYRKFGFLKTGFTAAKSSKKGALLLAAIASATVLAPSARADDAITDSTSAIGVIEAATSSATTVAWTVVGVVLALTAISMAVKMLKKAFRAG